MPRFASPSYRVPRITDDCMEFFSSPAKGGCRNGTWMLGLPISAANSLTAAQDPSPSRLEVAEVPKRANSSAGFMPLACHSAEGGTGYRSQSLARGEGEAAGNGVGTLVSESINTAVGHDASRGAIPPSAVVRKGVRALEHSLDSLSFQATRAWPPSKNGEGLAATCDTSVAMGVEPPPLPPSEGQRGTEDTAPPLRPSEGQRGTLAKSSPLPSSVGQWGSEAKAPPLPPSEGQWGAAHSDLAQTLADSISIEWTYDNQLFRGPARVTSDSYFSSDSREPSGGGAVAVRGGVSIRQTVAGMNRSESSSGGSSEATGQHLPTIHSCHLPAGSFVGFAAGTVPGPPAETGSLGAAPLDADLAGVTRDAMNSPPVPPDGTSSLDIQLLDKDPLPGPDPSGARGQLALGLRGSVNLGVVESQGRLQAVETAVQSCVGLFNAGKWVELGEVLASVAGPVDSKAAQAAVGAVKQT
eukprot:gene12193-15317_t